METYRLPKVVGPAVLNNETRRVYILPLPYTHEHVKKYMSSKYLLEDVAEGDEYKFGFMLETGMFACRALAKDCALENGQVKPGVTMNYGLECEHLL